MNPILLAAVAVAITCSPSTSGAANRPNILFVLADDWGYGDASVYGKDWIQTPAIDRVAREGLRFDNAYWSHIHSSFDSSDNRLYHRFIKTRQALSPIRLAPVSKSSSSSPPSLAFSRGCSAFSHDWQAFTQNFSNDGR